MQTNRAKTTSTTGAENLTGEIYNRGSGSNVASAVFKPLAYEGIGAPLFNTGGGTSALSFQPTYIAGPVPQRVSLNSSYPTKYYLTNRAYHGGEGFNRVDMRPYLRHHGVPPWFGRLAHRAFPVPPRALPTYPCSHSTCVHLA
jgi:hypothetical protein